MAPLGRRSRQNTAAHAETGSCSKETGKAQSHQAGIPTDKSPKEAPAPKSAGTPEGIITTDKDSILS